MLKAPFPYFGGKSLVASEVWAAFGDVKNYIEPFCGSAAVLLSAPAGDRLETVNDLDALIVNFWRAVKKAPGEVAKFADWPVMELDLFSRHMSIVAKKNDLTNKIITDPEYFDAKTAGWWVWGICSWLGGGFCSGNGPWAVEHGVLINSGGPGVNRKLPHLGDGGHGVNRKLPHLGDGGYCAARLAWCEQLLALLSDRLRGVRVASGDWRRVCTPAVTTTNGLTGIFFDPPYTKGKMNYAVGGTGGALASNVREWCAANGSNNMLRIVLCGHAGEHDDLINYGWGARQWKARMGYAKNEEAIKNAKSETLWCSPHCIKSFQAELFDEVL